MTAEPLELAGILLACGVAAAAIVLADPRWRAASLLLALIVAPLLVAGNVWDQPRVVDLRESPLRLVLGIGIGTALVVAAALVFKRWPQLFPVAAIAVLPLRVPIEIGGETANLLVPLYVVIAAAAITTYKTERSARLLGFASGGGRVSWGSGSAEGRLLSDPRTATGALRWLLAATLVLYAIQAAYSRDVSNAIENAGFFLVPFAVLFALLVTVEWTQTLLRRAVIAAAAVAVVCAVVALVQYAIRDIFLNPELLDANQLHAYFRVNSIFYDPNIFGRYMALAVTALGACIAWNLQRRELALALLACGICLAGLVFAYSLTSIAALVVGLAMIAMLRWGWRHPL